MLSILRGWREDSLIFVQHDLPKIVLFVAISMVLIKVLRVVTREIASPNSDICLQACVRGR